MTELKPDPAAAREMLTAFASVGVRAFDVTLTDVDGNKVAFQINRSVDELRGSIGRRLEAATVARQNFIIRPRPDGKLIQLDDLDSAKAAKVAPYAFLIFETSAGNFQAWVALDSQTAPDLAGRLKRGIGADRSASGAARIAGSFNFKTKYAPEFPRVCVTHAEAGRVTTPAALESAALLAAPQPPPRVSRQIAPHYRGPRKWPDYQRNLARAPLVKDDAGNDKPDVSNADFVWSLTALDWGWSAAETAAKLAELSEKARQWERYAPLTVEKAAAALAHNRAAAPKKDPARPRIPG